MSGSTRVRCTCTGFYTDGQAAEFQDKKYGRGIRVANYNGKGHASCTVCGTVHTNVPGAPTPSKKK